MFLKMIRSAHELALCPGFGERKVNRLVDAFTAPFVPRKEPPPAQAAGETSREAAARTEESRDGRS